VRRQDPAERRQRKAKIQRAAAVALGLLFTVLLVKTVAGGKHGGPPASTRGERAAAAEVVELPGAEEARALPPPISKEEGAATRDTVYFGIPPDPFRPSARLRAELTGVEPDEALPPAPPEEKPVLFTLTGIVVDHTIGEYVALIDGAVLRAGDVHRGCRVLEIQPDRAVLEKGGERYVLELKEK
jgi:hypothetical protein